MYVIKTLHPKYDTKVEEPDLSTTTEMHVIFISTRLDIAVYFYLYVYPYFPLTTPEGVSPANPMPGSNVKENIAIQ